MCLLCFSLVNVYYYLITVKEIAMTLISPAQTQSNKDIIEHQIIEVFRKWETLNVNVCLIFTLLKEVIDNNKYILITDDGDEFLVDTINITSRCISETDSEDKKRQLTAIKSSIQRFISSYIYTQIVARKTFKINVNLKTINEILFCYSCLFQNAVGSSVTLSTLTKEISNTLVTALQKITIEDRSVLLEQIRVDNYPKKLKVIFINAIEKLSKEPIVSTPDQTTKPQLVSKFKGRRNTSSNLITTNKQHQKANDTSNEISVITQSPTSKQQMDFDFPLNASVISTVQSVVLEMSNLPADVDKVKETLAYNVKVFIENNESQASAYFGVKLLGELKTLLSNLIVVNDDEVDDLILIVETLAHEAASINAKITDVTDRLSTLKNKRGVYK